MEYIMLKSQKQDWVALRKKTVSLYPLLILSKSDFSPVEKKSYYTVCDIYAEIRYEQCKNGVWALTEDFAFITSF